MGLDPRTAIPCARRSSVPPEWELIAYLCVGYPREEYDAPELEREGWERIDERARTIYER